MGSALPPIVDPQPRGPLIGVQEVDGKTLYVDERSFARAGLCGAEILGVSWREFTPIDEHESELLIISGVLKTGVPAYPHIWRQWPTRTVRMVSKTSLLTTKGGTKLLMREAHVIDPMSGPPISLMLDAQGPLGELDAIEVIEHMLGGAAGLAAREEWSLLRYLIEMVRKEAKEQREQLIRSI